MPEPIFRTTDLIFPETSGNFNHTLSSLKQSRLSVRNRLSSIIADAEYVQRVGQLYNRPLVANERCGSWYIPPEMKGGSAYFKSTDGHESQWKFSTRRLNLQLLGLAGEHEGCVIVDSTRRGKLMPDALSKTIPIWCAVMNRFLFPEKKDSHSLVVSEQVVSASEASQISERLDAFVSDMQALSLDKTVLRASVKLPLRPYFVAPGMEAPDELEDTSIPIICCSASRREHGDNDSYVQGAGDDNEHWSRGLTANMFWEHRDLFKTTMSDERLEDVIDNLLSVESVAASGAVHEVYQLGSSRRVISICDKATLEQILAGNDNHKWSNERPYDLLVACDTKPGSFSEMPAVAKSILLLPCCSGKNGSRALRKELAQLEPALVKLSQQVAYRVLLCCSTGKDLSVGVALAFICRLEQMLDPHNHVDKPLICQRLAALTTRHPSANPSRSTLQSVNTYLMQDRCIQ